MCYVHDNGYVQQAQDVFVLLDCMVNKKKVLIMTIKGKYVLNKRRK